MTYKLRFSLIGFGVVLFLIATPFLVLFARGFTFDWHSHRIVKTGTMVVKTDPTGAVVYLDSHKQASTTPTNIRFLAPKDYDVRIEKDGYQAWTKRLSVRPQLVTWANDNRDVITLFFSQPKLEQTWSAKDFTIDTGSGGVKKIDSIVQPLPTVDLWY